MKNANIAQKLFSPNIAKEKMTNFNASAVVKQRRDKNTVFYIQTFIHFDRLHSFS